MIDKKKSGKVYLVGAGPGDVGLITVKGLQVLREADVIFYDYLANPSFLSGLSSKIKLVYVGKKGASHFQAHQTDIETMMIAQAKKGKTVVRLKGGDPFVFGRGGEELQTLMEAGIPCEVIPGVSSGMAVPAYAGIPVTHRDYTSELVFVTGHEDPSGLHREEFWKGLVSMRSLVFLMGYHYLKENMEQLLKYGMDPQTPAAMIQWGTYPQQKTVVATVGTMAAEAQNQNIKPPTIVVVGAVVSLREKLNWFEKRPLHNQTVLVTRTHQGNEKIKTLLEVYGAHVLEMPLIQIAPMSSWASLDAVLKKINRYRWIVFSSHWGVHYFWQRMEKMGKDARFLEKIKIACVGEKTAASLRQKGIHANLIPKNYNAESLVKALKKKLKKKERVLIVRAKEGHTVVEENLEKIKQPFDLVFAYQNKKPKLDPEKWQNIFTRTPCHWVVFLSASAVKNFISCWPKGMEDPSFQKTRIACMGPMTQKEARLQGLPVHCVPPKATIESLVETMLL